MSESYLCALTTTAICAYIQNFFESELIKKNMVKNELRSQLKKKRKTETLKNIWVGGIEDKNFILFT